MNVKKEITMTFEEAPDTITPEIYAKIRGHSTQWARDKFNQKDFPTIEGGKQIADKTAVKLYDMGINPKTNPKQSIEFLILLELKKLNEERKNNFNDEKILNELKFQSLRYGKDEKEVIQLTNLIITWIGEYLKDKNNKYDGKYKFGLSAPSYIDESREFEATFDGRRIGEPFIVHISSDITSNPYTELIQFASKLDYNKASFNGNVIDFMVTPSFIESNKEKFLDFLILSTKVGFFQMQMNVVSSEILIKAKKNPKEFPDLIVRVWGFSAYFNDLPEEYKNLLIERALKSEGIDY